MDKVKIKFILKGLIIFLGMMSLFLIYIFIGVIIIVPPIFLYVVPATEFYLIHLGISENDSHIMFVFCGILICYFILLFLTACLITGRIKLVNMSKVKIFFEKHFPMFYFIFIRHKDFEVRSTKKIYVLQEMTNGYPNQPQLFNNFNEAESEYLRLAYYFAFNCLGPCCNLEPFKTTEEALDFFDAQDEHRRSRGYHLRYWTLDDPNGEC